MKWIFTTMLLIATTVGANAQYVTYNHDSPKMNQITQTGFFVKRYRKDNEIGVLSQNALPANAAESIL